MRKAIIILEAIGLLCLCLYFGPHRQPKKPTRQPSAQFITLQVHIYFIKLGKQPTPEFQSKVTGHAAELMAQYEKVVIEYYINEDGDERAMVIAEKKIWK